VSLNEISQIVAWIFVSVGGAGFIFWKLSSYLGNIWASKYFEKIKAEYQKELEKYKNELSLLKEKQLRYSSKQFEEYSQLWNSLYDLKLSADKLWRNATERNLNDFARNLAKAEITIEKSSLFIEDEHYKKLKDLLNTFNNFRLGKGTLKEYKEQRRSRSINEETIKRQIEENRKIKEEYEKLIYEIRDNLKKQLKLK